MNHSMHSTSSLKGIFRCYTGFMFLPYFFQGVVTLSIARFIVMAVFIHVLCIKLLPFWPSNFGVP